MTTMHAAAVITAVDRASAVFHRVGAAAAAQARVFGTAAGAVGKYTSAASGAIGAGGLLAAAVSIEGEKQLDTLTRLMQSAGELSASQRDALKNSALEASLKTGVKALELIQAQREAIQGGIDPQTSMAMTETFAKVSRANGIEAAKVAEDAINVSNALGFAMGTIEEKVASLEKSMNFMSVVPNLSTESWEGLRTSLKYAAPVAGALKIPISELGAALSILADAGFKGEQGGTALRTILLRAIAPTRQARLEMRALGIDLDKLYRFDPSKLGDTRGLAERVRGAGLGQGVDLERVLRPLGDPSKYEGVYAWQDAAQEILSKALKIRKGDAEARGILNKVLGGHVNAANSGFDLETFFRGIAKMPIQALKELTGTQRTAQAESLRKKINEILKLPSGERVSRLRHLANEFERLMPGAIDRRAEPVMEGFAYAVDRAVAALTRLRSAVFDSGVGGGLADILGKAATSIEKFSKTNPQALRDITIALAGLAALGPAAFILKSVGGGLTMISTAVARLGASRLLLGGGLGALLLGDIGKLFEPDTFDPFGAAESPYDRLRGALVGFGGEAAGALGDLSRVAGEAYTEVKALFGFDGKGSLLLDSINALVKALEIGTASIKFWRDNVPAILGGKPGVPAGEQGSWIRDAWNKSNGLIDQLRSPTAEANGGAGRFAEPRLIGDVGRFAAPGLLAPQRVDVQGEAQVKVQNEITVKVEGPGVVTQQRGGTGTATVPLNVGKSMPDAGAN